MVYNKALHIFFLYWVLFIRILGASGSRDYDNRHYYVFHFSKKVDLKAFSDDLGFKYEKALENLEDHYLFSISKEFLEEEVERKVSEYFSGSEDGIVESFEDKVLFYQKQHLKRRYRKTPPVNYEDSLDTGHVPVRVAELEQIKQTLDIKDPIFGDQWHLYNLKDKFNDINVTSVWKQGITGKNVTVAIIDDGLDMTSEDLKDNYYPEGSYDFNDHNPVPMPKLPEDTHGTRCAGEVAAVRNTVCGIGVAYESKVSGLRILSGPITDLDEAESLNYDFHKNHIYSCSWGPDDDGKTVDGPSSLVLRALINGVNNGRNGLGSIYVFASGNGGIYEDNCNFDGYANSVFTITIGGIDKHGKRLKYSEACSSQLAVTYAGGSAGYIYTTDVGTNKCTSRHGGTSAAAPLAAGILALVLSVRPKLTWRDLQALIRISAVPVNLHEYGWEKTHSGLLFHDFYGYGKLDASLIIENAKKFKHLKPQARFSSRKETVNKIFSKNNGTITSKILIDSKSVKSANLGNLEHLIITVNIVHSKRGDLEVFIISPNGVTSRLASRRVYDFNSVGILNWNFVSVKHWGESFLGNWTIRVNDKNNPNVDGSFMDWQIHLWGEAIDPKKAKPIPYPVVFTSNKTSNQTSATSTSRPTATSSSTSKTTSATATKTSATETTPTSGTEHPTSPDKTKTQKGSWGRKAWLYFIVTFLILAFISALCYIYFQRRSRIKQSLIEESYEFEVLRDDEEDINYLFQDSEKAKILQENPEIYTAFDIHDDFDSASTSFRRE
ncbi:kexin KEX2 [Pneumocystis jirovecii RU7]|nr:kexin KEX2 [Pneumocystis jirovecii RU7]KTW26570.1 hypothetical protein T551_03487 [Pneumocystis jirovecii RU7]